MKTKISPEQMIAFAKSIDPAIFENKSPYIHKLILSFIDSDEKRKLVQMFRDGAKSTLLNNIYILKRIYFDNEPYIWIISDNGTKARSFLRKIKRLVGKMSANGWDIRRGEIYNENESEFITNGKVCGIACFGAGEDPRGYTSSEGGKRPTLIIADDILSREKARSAKGRDKLKDWFFSDVEPGLHPKGEILMVGTPLHKEDLLSECMRSGEYKSLVVPIIINGKSAWADRKPMEWIEKRKLSLMSKGMATTWYNEYLCIAQGEENQLFKPELFKYFKGLEYELSEEYLQMGNAKESLKVHITNPTHIILEDDTKIALDECVIYSTMDLSTESGKDKTAIITCAMDSKGNIYVIDISSGHWSPFRKSIEVLRVYKSFKPLRFGIERAGAQNDFFYTMDVAVKESGVYVPVEELSHKGVAKNIRISNLHPYFASGKIYFNASDASTNMLEAELSAFQIDIESSQDDHIDALAYVMQFIKGKRFKGSRVSRKNITAY